MLTYRHNGEKGYKDGKRNYFNQQRHKIIIYK